MPSIPLMPFCHRRRLLRASRGNKQTNDFTSSSVLALDNTHDNWKVLENDTVTAAAAARHQPKCKSYRSTYIYYYCCVWLVECYCGIMTFMWHW